MLKLPFLIWCIVKKIGQISDNLSQTGMKSTSANKNKMLPGHFVTSISRTTIILRWNTRCVID